MMEVYEQSESQQEMMDGHAHTPMQATPTVLPASGANEGEESVEGGTCEGVRCEGVGVC